MRAGFDAVRLSTFVLLAGLAMSSAHGQDAPSTAREAPAAGGQQSDPGTTAGDSSPLESEAGPTAPPPPVPRPDSALVVVSRGGFYAKSQDEAILRPFTRATGIKVTAEVYDGSLDRLRAQSAAGSVAWDVVDVDPAEAEAGCTEGLFEKLSFVLAAAPDGTDPTDDFLPGTVQPCAVGSVAWSMVIAHGPVETGESDRSGDASPQYLADFFDLTAFPGRRGLRRTPMANLEWALMADGVAPDDVYPLLRTEAGVERALAKLDTIREAVIWWEDASAPSALLSSGAVAMTSTYNAPIFNEIALRQRPFEVIWDGQVWDIDLWAIPAAAPSRDAALEFLRFATTSEALARQARWIPYGPVRRSATMLVGRHVLAEVEIAPHLPTTADNLETALRNDAVFWRQEGPALVERFNAWLAR